MALGPWICPICRLRLAEAPGAWKCPAGHSFDVAREGYVNLLVGRQRSGVKGDTRPMFEARRRWLESGRYLPLRQYLAGLAKTAGSRAVVAEAGCGEGYYLGGVCETAPKLTCVGFDLSKDGVKLAARRYPGAVFAAADTNRGLPWDDGSVDLLLDVFAPRNPVEFARVLRPSGRLVVVIPGTEHLAQLRATLPLLGIEEGKRSKIEVTFGSELVLETSERLNYLMDLSSAEIADLVGMTPNAWFLSSAGREKLAGLDAMSVTADFEMLVFIKP